MKYFFINFFPIHKSVNRNIIMKTKKGFQKRLVKGTKIFLKKKKTKSANMLLSNIEIFLKRKKKKKRQYDRERYKNLVEGDYRNFFSRMQEIKTG